MKISAEQIKRFLIVFGAGLILSKITALCPTPEKNATLWFALPGFIVFILYVFSLFSWGAWVRQKTAPNLSGAEAGLFDLTIGTLGIYPLCYLLTVLHLFSSAFFPIAWLVVAGGFALGFENISPSTWFDFSGGKLQKLFASLPLVIIALHLIEGLQFPQQGDPYYVYLPGPRTWAVNGDFSAFHGFSDFFFTTSWESLYAFGTVLLGLRGGHGLDLTQWFCQWISSGIGVLGVVLALYSISNRILESFPIQRKWLPLVVVYTLQIACIRWTANLAKNDMGIAFWAISAFYFSTFLAVESGILSFITGLLIGATVIGKLNTVFLGSCLALAVLIKAPKKILPLVFGGVVGVFPVIYRNWSMTHNPVFPWLSRVFGTLDQLGIGSASGSEPLTKNTFSLEGLIAYFKEVFFQNPLSISLLLVLGMKQYRLKALKIVGAPMIAMLLFIFALGLSTEMRLLGPSLLLISYFSAYFLFLVADQFKKFWQIGALVALFILASSNISFFTLGQVFGKKFGIWRNQIIRLNESGGPAKLWIREHLPEGSSILLVGDGYFYYLIDYALVNYGKYRQYEVPIIEKNIALAAETFKNAPTQYLYITNNTDFLMYRDAETQVIGEMKNWNQSCHLYDSENAHVWDLQCLKK